VLDEDIHTSTLFYFLLAFFPTSLGPGNLLFVSAKSPELVGFVVAIIERRIPDHSE
jgi:hypothetical protein